MSRKGYAALNADAVVAIVRDCAYHGLGFNCAFLDDDMAVIIGLAQRAVLAGLDTDYKPAMRRRFAGAAEKRRTDHETSLGRKIVPQ